MADEQIIVDKKPNPIIKELLLGVGGALVLGGVIYAAYATGLFSPGKAVVQGDLLASLDSIKSIDSAAYSVTVTADVKTRDKEVKAFFDYINSASTTEAGTNAVQEIGYLEDSLQYLPANASLKGLFAGTFSRGSDKETDGKSEFGIDVVFDDLQAAANIEFLKKATDYYVRVNKMPGLFIDVSPVKGSWVQVTQEDLAGSRYSFLGSATRYAGTKDERADSEGKQLQRAFEIAKQHNLILSTRPASDKVGEISADKYQVSIDTKQLGGYYTAVTEALATEFGEKAIWKYNAETDGFLKSPEAEMVFTAIRENSTLYIWVDKKTGYPIQLEHWFRLVPRDKTAPKLANRQLELATKITLQDINSPKPINIPDKFMTFDDAMILLEGGTKEEYLLEKQSTKISTITTALETYKTYSGAYPEQLTNLTATPNELSAKNPGGVSTSTQYYYYQDKDKGILEFIPKDVFTKKPFEYSRTGSSYTLKATVTYPEYVRGSAMANGLFTNDYTNYANPTYKVRYVDGVNTIIPVEKTYSYGGRPYTSPESQEANQASLRDADGDGLPDAMEKYLTTNPNKADTDGDGVSDVKELQSYSDPLGPGKLKY